MTTFDTTAGRSGTSSTPTLRSRELAALRQDIQQAESDHDPIRVGILAKQLRALTNHPEAQDYPAILALEAQALSDQDLVHCGPHIDQAQADGTTVDPDRATGTAYRPQPPRPAPAGSHLWRRLRPWVIGTAITSTLAFLVPLLLLFMGSHSSTSTTGATPSSSLAPAGSGAATLSTVTPPSSLAERLALYEQLPGAIRTGVDANDSQVLSYFNEVWTRYCVSQDPRYLYGMLADLQGPFAQQYLATCTNLDWNGTGTPPHSGAATRDIPVVLGNQRLGTRAVLNHTHWRFQDGHWLLLDIAAAPSATATAIAPPHLTSSEAAQAISQVAPGLSHLQIVENNLGLIRAQATSGDHRLQISIIWNPRTGHWEELSRAPL